MGAEDPRQTYRQMVGRRLRRERKDMGLSLEQAAEGIEAITGRDITGAAISSWERGETLPRLGNQFAVAQLYGRTVDDLFGHTETDADRALVETAA